MHLRPFSYKLYLSIVLFCLASNATSQTNDRIKLSNKLKLLEKKFIVNFSYNSSLFNTVFLDQNIDCVVITDCINKIQELVPVQFNNTSALNYMVLPVRKDIEFELVDLKTNENLSSLEYKINNKPLQYLKAKENVFTLKNIFLLDSIHILAESYTPIHIKAQELHNSKKLEVFRNQVHLDEVVLSSYITKGIDANITNHSIEINTESIGLLTGETDGDLFNVINTIPGIHSPSGKSGNLNFRGNTYDQNLVQIDDIPIYHSGHLLGAISPYNTSIVTNVEVHRNMLPAKYGGRVGGLIEMSTSDDIPDSTNYAVILNTLYAGATINTNLIKDKLSLSAAFRTGYPGFGSPKLEAISTLIFQGSRLDAIADNVNEDDDFTIGFFDMNAKLNYKINDKHDVALSFINIQNDLFAEIRSTSNNNNRTDFRDLELDNWGVTGTWKASFSEKISTEVRLSTSKMNLISESVGFVSNEGSNREVFDNTISDTRFITEITYDYSPTVTLEAGYTFTEHMLISNEVEEQNGVNTEREQRGVVHANYFSLEKNWNDKLHINVGLHNNYYVPLKKLYVNPRILASYTINNILYLKSSFGTSNQFIQKKFNNDFDDFNITNQLWFLPNDDISTLNGTQTMIGAVYNKSRWLIDLELYHKSTANVTSKIGDNQGNISSIGANIFVKRKWHNIEAWVSYSLSKTQTDFNGLGLDAFYDQPHTVNLTGLLNLNQWKFGLSLGLFSGMPIIFSDETNNNNLLSTNSDRFDTLHQLDFSSSYTFRNSSKSFKTVIGLSILNLYDQDNTVNIFQNTPENSFRKGNSFSPNLQVNLFF